MNGEQRYPAPHPIGGPTAHPGEEIPNLPRFRKLCECLAKSCNGVVLSSLSIGTSLDPFDFVRRRTRTRKLAKGRPMNIALDNKQQPSISLLFDIDIDIDVAVSIAYT